jgi:NADPH:quinone reductase-like Zn-dependent oxidoreductase
MKLAESAPAPTASPRVHRAYSLQRGASLDALRLETRTTPPPAAREVQVRMQAVALNHRDLMFADGRSGQSDSAVVPASDGAGTVVAVGSQVRSLRLGDRVVGSFFPDWSAGRPAPNDVSRALGGSIDGVLAEVVTLPDTAWVRVPDGIDALAAATVPCAGVTAWHALFELEPLPPGSRVALLGTGGVSIWALQLAKAAGLRVVVTSSDDAKLEQVRALGADATVNYRRTPQWAAAIQQHFPGGVDRVLDIGGPHTLPQSIEALRLGGTVAVIGRLTGHEPACFDPAALFGGMKRLHGVMVGSAAMSAALLDFVATHRIRPMIDRVFPFARAREAYEYLAAARHLGKVAIRID